jgi:hypothetical protein
MLMPVFLRASVLVVFETRLLSNQTAWSEAANLMRDV